ncbi:hypothetical protein, partial [Corynebacterium sp.]|uniref:hypothetical protein n=1 Tax=Corynebacterium sp. TaxID=1720 RepID=UPI00290A23B5
MVSGIAYTSVGAKRKKVVVSVHSNQGERAVIAARKKQLPASFCHAFAQTIKPSLGTEQAFFCTESAAIVCYLQLVVCHLDPA